MSFEISECLFADDAALICTSRSEMIIASRVIEEVTAEFGLTLNINIPRTKLLVAGVNLLAECVASLELGSGSVEVVKEFKYLERLIVEEINHRIAQSFTILCFSWLAILVWKRKVCMVYQSIVVGMYGAETLAPTQIIVRKLETFHHHCVRCIIGI